jgi:hypothetical protein
MKISGIVTGKFVMQLGIACAIILASAKDANAWQAEKRHRERVTVPKM